MSEDKEKAVPEAREEIPEQTPLELLRGFGEPVPPQRSGIAGMPPDSMLAIFKDRLTYTFILGNEVASIHFDRRRGEIFYKGHNIGNLALNDVQIKLLKGVVLVLAADERGKIFVPAYTATLKKWVADNI